MINSDLYNVSQRGSLCMSHRFILRFPHPLPPPADVDGLTDVMIGRKNICTHERRARDESLLSIDDINVAKFNYIIMLSRSFRQKVF